MARRQWRLDLGWLALAVLLARPLVRTTIGVVVIVIAAIAGVRAAPDDLVAELVARSPMLRLPLPLQVALTLLVADLLGYWIHRAFHRGRLWRFHAIHHGAEPLGMLSAVRVHPIDELVVGLLRVVPMVLLGFRFDVVATVAPLLGLWAIVLHANVDWRFGWLRFLIATPAFHRWHHAHPSVAADCNFAGLFPLWDLVFGTFRLPAALPERVGVREVLPRTVLGQLAWPLRKT
jgi:sterol desaturase/sphingolipid hydroxylase (fatty acid hydroxylase superfamily)